VPLQTKRTIKLKRRNISSTGARITDPGMRIAKTSLQLSASALGRLRALRRVLIRRKSRSLLRNSVTNSSGRLMVPLRSYSRRCLLAALRSRFLTAQSSLCFRFFSTVSLTYGSCCMAPSSAIDAGNRYGYFSTREGGLTGGVEPAYGRGGGKTRRERRRPGRRGDCSEEVKAVVDRLVGFSHGLGFWA
jgi:hypothetical protein